jgi:hypothetical protein
MAENQTTLREAVNEVVIEGIVSEINIEEKGEGKDAYITGEILIKTDKDSVHTVSVFSKKYNKDEKESSIYKGLQTIKNEYKSIAKYGEDEADRVRITTGKLGLNEYVGQNDEIKSYPQISANFINRLKAGEEFNPRAEFEVECVIKNVKPEMKNDEETGRAIVDVIIPVYGGKVIEFRFVATEENGVADYLLNNVEKGQTITLFGDVVNRTIVERREVGTGFGKPQEKIKSKTIREFVITGGNPPLDEDDEKAYSMDAIKKALVEREAYHNEMKEKKKQKESKSASGGKSAGFGAKKEDKAKKPSISDDDDDLPF